ncbi:CHAP domain-containing protein [Staphylococcus ratti]|uniref:CHAP domain-containing protein n=1 Tax=Staphylococcus ratti TaxID=2892440 RepID=A0ABY3PCG2_9STAP|nr:CHAP domain-containing protein [Staphylococcus ratti]UEX90025.1 CHAP domain-containing protein [Staphylococcus ratti]
MSNYFYKCITTFSTLTLLGTTMLDTSADASLKEDQKSHPNATFNVRQDGTYTYHYGTHDSNANSFKNSNSTQTTPHTPYRQQGHATDKYWNSDAPSTPARSATSQNIPTTIAPPPSLPSENAAAPSEAPSKKAFKRDARGLITSINTDTLYDELQILNFNEEARTEDGKPLALGNGKIIDQPIYTNKNNLYTAGQCTWYVFSKRAQAGKTISTFWGDARHWAAKAASEGFTVDKTPKVGAIMQNYEGPYGHVAYVERVNLDGSILISEMNYIAPYITSTRTIPASAVRSHNYIH